MSEDETARLYIEHRWPYGVTVGAGTAANDNGKPEYERLSKLVADTYARFPKLMGALHVSEQLDCLPFGITYLASPYSLYKHGFHMAARHASRAAASLMRRGLVVYAPISHGHAIACDNDLPTTWEFWKGQCQPFIDAASACVVLKLDGWKESVGVCYEAASFYAAGKPVVYVTPEELSVREETVEDEWKRRVA